MLYESNYYNNSYTLLAAAASKSGESKIKYFDISNIIPQGEVLETAPVDTAGTSGTQYT